MNSGQAYVDVNGDLRGPFPSLTAAVKAVSASLKLGVWEEQRLVWAGQTTREGVTYTLKVVP